MARRKVLPCFKNYRNGSTTEETKQKEMQDYREGLGDRKQIYALIDRHKNNLNKDEIDFINLIFRRLQKYDILGMNQELGILELAKLHSTIRTMERDSFKNIGLLFDRDYKLEQETGYRAYKESRFYRQLETNRRIFDKLFYDVLSISQDDFDDLEVLEVSTADNVDEIITLRNVAKLNEIVKRRKEKQLC